MQIWSNDGGIVILKLLQSMMHVALAIRADKSVSEHVRSSVPAPFASTALTTVLRMY